MARSPLTLAASVTSALPGVQVVGVRALTEGAAGRYDSAIAELDDGRRVVVRVPVDDDADADLRAESRALTAMTAGVRAVLPFGAPDVLGQTRVDGRHTLVQTLLPGYRVDAAHVPAGRGVATALAAAIAQVHDLPVTVVRDAGLTVSSASDVRAEAEALLDAAEATGLLPFGLLRRWSTALATDALWRFETTVILGGVDPAAFVLEDDADGVPVVTGLLSWGALGGGDPAVDLRWTASAPDARDDVLDAYARLSHRAPDSRLAERARLHAELEFARWLVHGHASGSADVTRDAVALLEQLAETVRDLPAVQHGTVTADDAIAASSRVPTASGPIDTSMHTDTFDPDTLAEYLSEEEARATRSDEADATVPIELSDWTHPDGPDDSPAASRADTSPVSTTPSDTRRNTSGRLLFGSDPVAAETPERDSSGNAAGSAGGPDGEDDDDLGEAARNAMRRWTGSA